MINSRSPLYKERYDRNTICISFRHKQLTTIINIYFMYCAFEVIKYTVSYRIVSYRIVSYRIVSYRIVSYRIVSYRIVSYRIVSYRIVSYRIVSYRIVSYRIVSYRIVSYRIVSYRIVSYRIVSYRIVSYRIVSYRIVSYRIVSYRIVSYRIVSYRIVLYYEALYWWPIRPLSYRHTSGVVRNPHSILAEWGIFNLRSMSPQGTHLLIVRWRNSINSVLVTISWISLIYCMNYWFVRQLIAPLPDYF